MRDHCGLAAAASKMLAVNASPIWSSWYAGRPVLVTANDYGLGLYNGDTGVTVVRDDALRAVIGDASFATSRLADVTGVKPEARPTSGPHRSVI